MTLSSFFTSFTPLTDLATLVAAACAQPLASIHPPFSVVDSGGEAQPAWAERVRDRGPEPASGQMPLLLPVTGGEPNDPGTVPPGVFAEGRALHVEPPAPASAASAEPELWQLHRTYILAPVRDGVVIVDQHAAHERILYEEAIARLRGAQGGSQGLLFPALVDLSRSQFELLLELLPHLQKLGWDLAPLSPPTVVIQGVPSGLKVESPAALLQDVLDGLGEGGVTAQDDLLERLANSHACHSAIRAGDLLSRAEMRMLVDRLFATTRPHGDPHGRPTFVRMDLAELHRRFGRT